MLHLFFTNKILYLWIFVDNRQSDPALLLEFVAELLLIAAPLGGLLRLRRVEDEAERAAGSVERSVAAGAVQGGGVVRRQVARLRLHSDLLPPGLGTLLQH